MKNICRLWKRGHLLSFSLFIASLILVLSFMRSSHREYISNCFFRQQEVAEVDSAFTSTAYPFKTVNIFLYVKSARYLSIQLKSVLYYRSSPVIIHAFVSTDILEKIVNILLSTWPAERVFFKVYRLSKEDCDKKVPTNVLHLLDCLGRHLPWFSGEGIYMTSDVLFKMDIGLWMERSSTALHESLVLSDRLICSPSKWCNGRPNLLYIDLKRIIAEATSNNFFSSSSSVSYPSSSPLIEKLALLPCQLTPFGRIGRSRNECNGSDDNMETIMVVSRTDFHTDRYSEDRLHQAISESVLVIDSSPPIVWPLPTTGGAPRNPRDQQPPFDSEEWRTKGYHSMSDSGDGDGDEDERKNGSCRYFLEVARLKRRTHLFYHIGARWTKAMENAASTNASSSRENIEVTLLTVLSLDRFPALELILGHWKGLVAILFYATDSEVSLRVPRMLSESEAFKGAEDRIAIHLVYQRLPYNPLNYLRNVLLNNTYTSHAFYLDVDLVPNPAIYESLFRHLKNNKKSNKLFIVPAFQSFIRLDLNMPKKKDDLLKLMKEEIVTGYKQKVGWALGHRPTNYKRWATANETYQAVFADAFEPYVVVPLSLGARFNEDLLERMGDKIAYVRLLHGMGYEFHVLPNDFVIHLPHPTSAVSVNYFNEPNLYRCGSILFEDYRKKLYEMFPERKF